MVSWRWARSLERILGTRRLQPQLRLLAAVALVAGLWPGVPARLALGPVCRTTSIPPLRILWFVGSSARWRLPTRRSFTAWQHSSCWAATGLVTCVTFVWLSAPDLALTQLLVES